jgi:hypothetical protein
LFGRGLLTTVVVAQPLDPVDRESSHTADAADADVGEGALAAEQHRCDNEITVDEARCDERREGSGRRRCARRMRANRSARIVGRSRA